jgi:uncharacterized protein
MKTLTLTISFILISYTLYGQDLAGQWNGALYVQENQIRIVFHVLKINNQYEATMDSPDQNASGIKVTTTSFSYPNVKFEISTLGVIYEGIVSDKSITGKWAQSGTELFLVLLRSEDSPNKRE